jgi:hypothetical protein
MPQTDQQRESHSPLKQYGPRSAVNGDGCREAIGSTIATDGAHRPLPA